MQHAAEPAGTRAANPPRRRARRRIAAWLAAPAAALLAAASIAATPAAAAQIVDRTWTGSAGAEVAVTFVAYTDGRGRSTITLTGAGANRSWTPTFAAGGCASVGTPITRLGAIATDADGSGSRVSAWTPLATGKAWSSTRAYGTFAMRLAAGATTRCAVLTFVRATRVQVSGVGIDLPVVRGGSTVQCNVAMYLTMANQPPERGVTFLYAHARTGMFLPLLTASQVNNGASLIGRTVYVYASDSRRYPYRITSVRRHQTSIQRAMELTSRQLWLQTSEGPYATSTKLVVVAVPAGAPLLVARSVAIPTPRPLACR
jgi:hypothetical protein